MTLNGHTGWVSSVATLPDGRLASCSEDTTVKVLDLSKPLRKEPKVMTNNRHTGGANSVTTATDGRQASGSPPLKRRKTTE
ncbi:MULTISPECIES: WD40 repeat domain-containing protein [unclassified Endozoicomonas]|uniref:WD40 repeat domain-containing protein n=1 Tax=unclassified Endozoicomonas TaxID=2644528 RepID=UPI003BB74D82